MSVRAHMGHGHALLRLHKPLTGDATSKLGTIRQRAESYESNLVIWRASDEVRAQIDAWGGAGAGLPTHA